MAPINASGAKYQTLNRNMRIFSSAVCTSADLAADERVRNKDEFRFHKKSSSYLITTSIRKKKSKRYVAVNFIKYL